MHIKMSLRKFCIVLLLPVYGVLSHAIVSNMKSVQNSYEANRKISGEMTLVKFDSRFAQNSH